ncbi:LysR family transcriptional regulator [Peribacillus simplex]|uniref:LysR family transcriptional regulator n=1 Tax=Peribacillus TaxID=2675229 RepID=UPI001628F606|nr:LysR family transcriptional regulator [Peribacillus simplex]
MDIQDLRIFRTVAHQGSISKAASLLSYVQSSVTTRIQHLEKELHTPLLHRHNRGISLTSAGRTLLSYADKILPLFDEAQRAFEYTSTPSGSLIIGAIESTATVRLPLLFSTYHEEYPDVDITLVTDTSEELMRALLKCEIDCAFVAGNVDHPEIVQETVFHEQLVFVTHPLHPPIKELKDLYDSKLYLYRPGCYYRLKFESWLQDEGIIPTKINELGNLDIILNCVRAGLGIALMVKTYAEPYEANGLVRCHPIPKKDATVTTSFIYRRDNIMEPMLKLLEDTIKHEGIESQH